MIDFIIKTERSHALAIVRIVLAIVILAHGAQKLFGWFGGHGPAETIAMWSQWWNMPTIITILVIATESFGAFALLLGFLGKVMAACVGVVMVGAVYLVHFRWGFYMNWYFDPQRGEGFEYHLLVFAMVAAIITAGSGSWSVDLWLTSKRKP